MNDINQLRPSWVRKINVAHVQDLVPGECWLWTGSRNGESGYGRVCISNPKRTGYLHRVVYEILVGQIPDGLELDHLCRQPPCCNPSHLEPVLPITNVRRGIRASQTHCKNKHPLSGDNLYLAPHSKGYRRVCRTCRDAHKAVWDAARAERKRQTWHTYLGEQAVSA